MMFMQPKIRRKRNPSRGLVAGLIGGLIGSWIMNEYQRLWSEITEGKSEESNTGENKASEDDTTIKTAEAVSQIVLKRPLRQAEKEQAGNLVHYGFGAVTGAAYGLVAEYKPSVTKGMGIPDGTFVWLQADELAVPALGLSKTVSKYPLSTHIYALTSHLVFGFGTEIVRRIVRASL